MASVQGDGLRCRQHRSLWLVSFKEDLKTEHLRILSNLSKKVALNIKVPLLRSECVEKLIDFNNQITKLDNTFVEASEKLNKFQKEIETVCNRGQTQFPLNTDKIYSFLLGFKWNYQLFNPSNRLENFIQILNLRINSILNELQILLSRVHSNHSNLESHMQQDTSSLTKKFPSLVVSDSNITISQFLQTIFIVVSKSKSELFYKNVDNEKYDVVPKTLVKVAEDQNSIAFVVVVMKKNSKPFIEFLNSLHFSACEILNGYESEKSFWADRAELQERLDAAITVSRSWLDMTSVDFINLWIHLKIICLHVSSVLKFGKVKNSSTVDLLVLSIPLKSQEKAVKEALAMIGHQILSAAQSKQVLIGPTNKKKIEEFQLPYSIQEFLMCC